MKVIITITFFVVITYGPVKFMALENMGEFFLLLCGCPACAYLVWIGCGLDDEVVVCG